ncbi:unannotated protein [freshwater metagenome]|uniref:Unannotated protein n=1 Tax=freshwater metagenome TaxID=449393 RepID=A0A6J6U0J3_9ZZZZ
MSGQEWEGYREDSGGNGNEDCVERLGQEHISNALDIA